MATKPKQTPEAEQATEHDPIEARFAALEGRQNELAARNATLEAQLRVADGEAQQAREMVQRLMQEREERTLAGEDTSPRVEMTHEPFSSQNPLKILADLPATIDYPEGQKLAWKDPIWRNSDKGWNGWIPITKDDEIDLAEHIPDPPIRMLGEEELDGYIRRMGLVLCRLDMRIWKARKAEPVRKDAQRRGLDASSVTVHSNRPGVSLVGPGMQHEDKPSFGGPDPLIESDTAHRHQPIGAVRYTERAEE